MLSIYPFELSLNQTCRPNCANDDTTDAQEQTTCDEHASFGLSEMGILNRASHTGLLTVDSCTAERRAEDRNHTSNEYSHSPAPVIR
jgi:hypothetical protein